MVGASCHCGNIKLSFKQLPDSITSCNCSICNRLGALWGSYLPEEVKVDMSLQASDSYLWGDKYVEFFHCKSCGCTTHYLLTDKCDEKKIAINCRMIEPRLIKAIPVKKFDGADTWEFIEE